MKYQVSLDGHNDRQSHIQFICKNTEGLESAMDIAGKYKNGSSVLEERECPLNETRGDVLDTVCLLFSDRAQAIADGVPEQDIKEVWPDQNKDLYRYITHRFG